MSKGKVSKVETRAATAMVAIGLAMAVACWSTTSAWGSGDINTSACPNEALSGFSARLPDCRVFEMVTPPYKDGYPVSLVGIAENGSRMVGNSLGLFAGAVGAPGTRNDLGSYYELSRGPHGWQTTPLTPENPQFRAATTFYTASADLSTSLFMMPTAPVGEDDFYLRTPGSSLIHVGPAYPPADGPATEPGIEDNNKPSYIRVVGGSADLSHIAFRVENHAWDGDTTASGYADLYEYDGSGKSAPTMLAVTGGPGSTEQIGHCGSALGAPNELDGYNAVSEDGNKVFFTPFAADHEPCPLAEPAVAELYARVDQSETVRVSAPECQSGCASTQTSDSVFQGASRDGSKAFFLSTQKLSDLASEDGTPGDSAYLLAGSGCQESQGTGCNLYQYDFRKPAGERLTTLSAGSLAPHVQGVVRISEDGSHVYFVAQGKLTGTANPNGEEAEVGANNLYVFEQDARAPEGHTTFIADLAPSDQQLWGGTEDQDARPAQATPDGRFLAFESHAHLTSDDTSGGVWQVFEYAAETQTLRRVSVGDGGFNNNGNTNQYDATIISPTFRSTPGPPVPAPLALSNNGAYVFFESADDLTTGMGAPESGTGHRNVYEYHEGRVYLMHAGTDFNVYFRGTSADGSDAFFETADRLVPQDTDTQLDLYDARIDGGYPVEAGAATCQPETCLGPLTTPPILAVAGTNSAAEGNATPIPTTPPKAIKRKTVAQCAKHTRRKQRKCAKPRARKQARTKTSGSPKGAS